RAPVKLLLLVVARGAAWCARGAARAV
ncbi:hypothetical protein A2U01_0116469, partial [Trifolium medium]|nr:hypothetical protein [Trifolium medium]